MCGILGFISDDIQYPAEAYQFMGALLDESKRRGRDAAGFAAVAENRFITDKHAVSAEDFIRLSRAFRSLRGKRTISFIGHTRAATNGSPSINTNNHPFHGPRYSMVHNGGVYSFRAIANKYNFDLKTNCDSELILHFLESRKNIRDGIIDAFSALDATSFMAVATLDRDNGNIHLFRNSSSPCVIMRIKRWNATIFASTLSIILDAAEKAFGDVGAVWEWADLEYCGSTGADFDIPTFSHVVIKPDGSVEDNDLIKDVKIDKSFSHANYYYSGGWYGEDDDIAAFSGGASTYNKTIGNNEGQPKCCKCKKFIPAKGTKYIVNGKRICRKCYRKSINVNTNKSSAISSYWKCIECYKNLDESLGNVSEVGSTYVCRECWDEVDHVKVKSSGQTIVNCANCNKLVVAEDEHIGKDKSCVCYKCFEDANSGNTLDLEGTIVVLLKPPRNITFTNGGEELAAIYESSSTQSRPIDTENYAEFEARLRSCIPREIRDEFGNSAHLCVKQILDNRESKYDHELDPFSMTTYVRQPRSIEDKLYQWEDMNSEKLHDMDDGEYLAYTEFLDEILVDT